MNKITEISKIEFEMFANNCFYTLRYYLSPSDDNDEKTSHYCNNVEDVYLLKYILCTINILYTYLPI